jgi:carboxymethylenebutenolidase
VCHPDQISFQVRDDMRPEPVALRVADDRTMPCLLQRGDGGGMPVLLITDVYGPTPFYQGLAGNLADHGFPTLIPDYLRGAGVLAHGTRDEALARGRRLDQGECLDDLGAAVDWLRSLSPGQGDRIGVLGFCLGGTLALDLATQRSDLAVVTYYAFPDGFEGRNPVPAPIDVTDAIEGPVLSFWGEQDYIDLAGVRRFCERLARRDTDFAFEIYPDVGHSFLGGLAEGDETAVQSWSRTHSFFAGDHDRVAASTR